MSHTLLFPTLTRLPTYLRPIIFRNVAPRFPQRLGPSIPLQLRHSSDLKFRSGVLNFRSRSHIDGKVRNLTGRFVSATDKNGNTVTQMTREETPNRHEIIRSWWCPFCIDPNTQAQLQFTVEVEALQHKASTGHEIRPMNLTVVEIRCNPCFEALREKYVEGQVCEHKENERHRGDKTIRMWFLNTKTEEARFHENKMELGEDIGYAYDG